MEKVPFGWKEQPVEIFFPSSFLSLEKKIGRDRRGMVIPKEYSLGNV